MYDETTYHIYAQDRCLYANLKQDEFDETWEMLKVMVGVLKTDYTERDLSYIKLGPKCGVGGPGRLSQLQCGKKIVIDIYILSMYN